MKVALVHDYLKEPGGAEAVLMALKEIWPEAPVYTANKFPRFWGRYTQVLEKWEIRESWGKWLPFLPKLISHYTILSPLFFAAFDLSDYDLVVVSATGGYFPNAVKIGSKTKLVTYCHTPPRFLYGYDTATKERYKWYWRPVSEVANHILRMADFKLAQRPDLVIANSRNVRNRIRKFWRREAAVVYPPIEVSVTPLSSPLNLRGEPRGEKKRQDDYFVIVSRIIGSKNIELAVEAAKQFKFKLKVAGKPIGRGGNEIVRKITGKHVEYLGEVSEQEKAKLLAEAKGFLALEKDSDFGMTAVEPQVYGTPVVAFRNGGYLEAVVENITGVFFDKLTPEDLWEGIQRFNKLKWDERVIRNNAARFSKERFNRQILELVSKI
ncbi:hypothetical protein A3H89_03115 [Candidatus Amesbacteria bacterium RIFCSPLOWO2_02_FULL_48_11]|uniref:Glycosyl transferase family 1 domain-containing protein n=2 Tax=Candidatus Amesiibacteriota TaxID=1752730 RepID=A0A1F4Z8R9_9BACT|nr:MAG: Glycosyl transferase, group 1 [Candidatus Amesbacteria bacterium GW2011_GWA1_48_9]OGC90896.1 MAG: hypothetical protein A2V48_01960 [Candidatus Amesbacteria bacterium RBG_19FT_COMBO_48_16]OGC99355.1 MAG: hypothetical protein A2702_03095 [Candidatus Amesbacteria bacterium RIFCSPHIGHO2_01_FULL_48_75]OGD02407.1 MAG: hypothetical protein A3E17_04935 [Candidatus Amesbacteria bacterium RIFCSPHIGHO2_12_FULL_48_14]OGD02488.1 MAG: hypothetical protein A2354_01960 [Candidatus Amesbacteria bacteriu